MFLLLAPTAALAASLSCSDLQTMVRASVPVDAIVATIADTGVDAADLGCVETAGLPVAVVEAARQHIVTPAPTPVAAPPPPTPPSRVSPAAAPEPALPWVSAGAGVGECSSVWFLTTTPDPGAAAALSGFVGFGSGNFYSKRPTAGFLLALTQIAAAGVAVGGGAGHKPKVSYAGFALLAATRAVDVGAAVGNAHAERRAVLTGCGG